ncbi:SusC/RagA family TonB-linked outer membrane protein [Psychroflexus montanilacus]|uniref:SusC/RagA family TonB-linked outer membrane protein n=1 Tax=Psychroflexus montanilacus TaxID=2873598 RepID=UPI001CCE15E9|nr:SusC/RagA family TonB-linked outer membrane protein [Psychroflexus montanilacus]MBZ9650866.1 SusC/RagA family TonB-linked outer membrane protein [Psychroflexus montanilacus]
MKNKYSRLKRVALIYIGGIFLFLSVSAHAETRTTPLPFQQNDITGVVEDPNGLPIPGVSVSLKNTITGTVTNQDGEYSITAPSDGTLVFSYVGFKSLEQDINGQREINIQLEEDVAALDEVKINAGYYNTTKRNSTGNISRVTAEDIELQPVVSPIQALAGRMAGVSVVQNTGIPGTAPQIQIRGQSSLRTGFENNGNLPLYIIDGVPVDSSPINSFSGMTSAASRLDPLSTLNLSNIQSIEILKDADATAIYGSRGANGVILITTKNGENFNQKTRVSARIYSGVSQVSQRLDLLNTADYIQLREEAFANDGAEPTPVRAEDLLLWDRERYTDWQENIFGGTAETTNANVMLSGGGKNTSFQMSNGYFKTGTVFPGDFGYQKWSSGLSLNHRSDDNKFKARVSVNYGVDVNNQFNSASFVSNALLLPPNAPALYNEDGSLNWEDSTWTNPLAETLNRSNAKTQQLVSNLGLSYEVVNGLLVKVNAGYTALNNEELVKNPIEALDPSFRDNAQARSSHSFTNRNSWIIEPQIDFQTTTGDLNIEALVGATFQEQRSKNLRASAVGYSNEQLVGNLAAAGSVFVSNNQEIQYRYNAIFARLGLNLKERYLLNFTGRRDGSSRFGPGKQFANFGAIGAAWIFTEENLFENLPWLSFGKLRGSYGITGNDQIQDYGYLATYSPTPAPGGLFPTQLVNPDYSWETNNKLEAAVELGFLDDRIRIQASYFRNRSSNQLVGFPLPSISGFTSVQANLPATVQNTGLELDGSFISIQTPNWRWETNFNLTLPRNKLVSYPNIEDSPYANIYEVGEPLSIIKLYRYNGVDPETGLFEVEDVNEDGSINFEDQVVNADVGRQYFAGLQNQVNYKNLSLSFLFEFVGQDGVKFFRQAAGRMSNVFQSDFDNRWRNPGDTGVTQRASQSIFNTFTHSNAFSSEYLITDASFVRLRTLALSYQLPVKSSLIRSSRIIVTGQNLLTISDYKGLDPQSPGSDQLPELATITAGLEINF